MMIKLFSHCNLRFKYLSCSHTNIFLARYNKNSAYGYATDLHLPSFVFSFFLSHTFYFHIAQHKYKALLLWPLHKTNFWVFIFLEPRFNWQLGINFFLWPIQRSVVASQSKITSWRENRKVIMLSYTSGAIKDAIRLPVPVSTHTRAHAHPHPHTHTETRTHTHTHISSSICTGHSFRPSISSRLSSLFIVWIPGALPRLQGYTIMHDG